MGDLSKRMPWEELKQTPEYLKLTPKQKLFVATYCQGVLADGKYDATLAVFTAYRCKSMEIARIMSYPLMSNIRIVAVLNRHFQTEPTEEFLAMLDRAINNKHITHAQVNALKLKCEVLGLGNRLPVIGIQEQKDLPPKPHKEKKKPILAISTKKSEYDLEAERF